MKHQAKEKGKRGGRRGSQGPGRHRVGPGEGPRAEGRERAREAERRRGRREGQGGRLAALTQPRYVERAGVWPTGQASGNIMGWRGLRRQGEYYGLEQP